MSATEDLDSVIQRASIALGYPHLRPKQYEAVKLFLEGNDVFVVLPTLEATFLIPSHVHVMALTATATKRTVARVSAIVGLEDPKLITVSPDKPNMCYWVKPRAKLEDLCAPLVARLCHQRTAMPRVIIYCKKCEDCASIYYFFLPLGIQFTDPISVPNLSQFHLVHVYTGVTHKDIQNSIIASFRDPAAPLCIVVATVAFGMGVDCSSVSQIIHWKPPADMESYLQECG